LPPKHGIPNKQCAPCNSPGRKFVAPASQPLRLFLNFNIDAVFLEQSHLLRTTTEAQSRERNEADTKSGRHSTTRSSTKHLERRRVRGGGFGRAGTQLTAR
jgi:hypothetical protein